MPRLSFKTFEIVLLGAIVLLAAFLYLTKLGSIPPGLYVDEAATGYNAYSILKTGKDEYGKFLPIAMRLLGSYTPPLYIYLSLPLVATFGLSIFSVRLLSALCGLLTIIVVYLITKDLDFIKSKFTPLIAALIFATAPWTVFFSRLGYEQNLALFMFSLAVLLILRSLRNPKLLMITVPVISLATYADWGQRLLAPLLFIGALIIFRKKLLYRPSLKFLLIGSFIALLIQIPNLTIINSFSSLNKNEHFYLNIVLTQAEKIARFLPFAIAVPLAFIREFLSKFFTYLSPRSLFFLPDPDPQVSSPGLSVFYPWLIILYFTGLYVLWQERKSSFAKFLWFLILIAPIPASLTREPFHTQRSLILLLPLTLLFALGTDRIIKNVKTVVWLPILSFLLIISLVMLWRSYFILLPQERAGVWGSKFVKLAEYIRIQPTDNFVIDQSERTRPQDIAYIQLAFLLKIPPATLQADQDSQIAKDYYNQTNFSFIHKFANIETKKIDWGETVWKNEILVGDLAAISDSEVKLHALTPVFEIKDPNDEILLRGFRTHPK